MYIFFLSVINCQPTTGLKILNTVHIMSGHVYYRLAVTLQQVMFRLCLVVIYLSELEFCESSLIRIPARPKDLNEYQPLSLRAKL